MIYSTIDGDISDFIEATGAVSGGFRTDELRQYLLTEGHSESEVRDAVLEWQQYRFQRVDGSWDFTLTPAGLAAVKELRARIE